MTVLPDRPQLVARAREARDRYRDARPYPHAVFDGFLGAQVADELAASFPGPAHPGWIRRDHKEQAGRLGQLQRTNFAGVDVRLRHLLAELNGMVFLDFLEALTRDQYLATEMLEGARTLRGAQGTQARSGTARERVVRHSHDASAVVSLAEGNL